MRQLDRRRSQGLSSWAFLPMDNVARTITPLRPQRVEVDEMQMMDVGRGPNTSEREFRGERGEGNGEAKWRAGYERSRRVEIATSSFTPSMAIRTRNLFEWRAEAA